MTIDSEKDTHIDRKTDIHTYIHTHTRTHTHGSRQFNKIRHDAHNQDAWVSHLYFATNNHILV